MTLQTILGSFLNAPKKRAPDLGRASRERFKRKVRDLGSTYAVVDGYVEIAACEGFAKGITIPHYDWTETAERLDTVLADPTVLDSDGYHTV